jgi:hypothetical protein
MLAGGGFTTFRPAAAAPLGSSKVPFCAVFDGILLGVIFLWGNHRKRVDLDEARQTKSERI